MPSEAAQTRRIVRWLRVVAVAGLIVGGGILFLSGDDDSGSGPDQTAREGTGSSGSGNAEPEPRNESDRSTPTEPVTSLPPTPCPPDLSNCVSATGRVLYVEKVDPDGDGDAHFVTASKEGITGPGITIFDVRTDLRPDPLPGVGDLVGGAGPVYPGSAGQKQIEVVVFEVAE